jgi:hypothetical protein
VRIRQDMGKIRGVPYAVCAASISKGSASVAEAVVFNFLLAAG